MSAENMKVTLAYPLEHNGTAHRADSTVSLPRELAKQLLWSGRARLAEPAKKPATKTSATPAADNPAAEANAPKEK